MENKAVQFQIVDPYLREQYGGSHLLEVWNNEGHLVYEKVLLAECKIWQMQFLYFIFKPASEEDSYHDCYHILNLTDGTMRLVRDWMNDGSFIHVFFQFEGYFFIANNKTFSVTYIAFSRGLSSLEEDEDEEEEEEEPEKPKKPILRNDKPYRLGLNNYTLIRSKKAYEDVNHDDHYNAN